MRRFLWIVAALILVGGVTLPSASAVVADAVPFADPAGDGGELDITTILIDTEPATGTVTFAVTVTGFDPASLDSRPRDLQIYLSPEPGGSELALIVKAEKQQLVPYVGHPKPPSWPFEPLPSTIGFNQSGNVLTWTFNKSEFGESSGFRFLMYTQIPDAAGTWHITDHAPDGGGSWWRYQYSDSAPRPPTPPQQPSVVRPVLGPPTVTPFRPRAGKRLAFVLSVSRSDNGAPLTTGNLVCDPRIAGALVKHTESFKNGKVRLSLLVPKSAKGRLLKVTVKITSSKQSATKIVNYKVT